MAAKKAGSNRVRTNDPDGRSSRMWYFSWILGLGLALVFGVLNAMWYEFGERDEQHGFGHEA